MHRKLDHKRVPKQANGNEVLVPRRASFERSRSPLLTSLFIDGTDNEQIWEQIDMRAKTVCSVLEDALGEAEQGDDDLDSDAETRKMLRSLRLLRRTECV